MKIKLLTVLGNYELFLLLAAEAVLLYPILLNPLYALENLLQAREPAK